jgi:hypothetical protein
MYAVYFGYGSEQEKKPKRDCPRRLRLAKSGILGKNKNRRRTAEDVYNFPLLLRLLININRNAALQRKG